MAAPHVVNEFLQKRMDRKDFLKHVAMGVAVLTGTAGIVKILQPSRPQANVGYGASAYGGSSASLPNSK